MSVDAYLKAMSSVWSPTTMSSEASRLRKFSSAMDGNPATLFAASEHLGRYTRRTLFLRAAAFWGWAHPDEPNPYHSFLKQNKELKHAYVPKKVPISFSEAQAAIEKISDPAIRGRAIQLLASAQRWSESCQNQSQMVKGKGGKYRPDFRPSTELPTYNRSYHTFWRHLKQAAGITPHSLRKLSLSRLAQKGATAPDLMRVAGWSSMAPALVYIQERRDEELREMMR